MEEAFYAVRKARDGFPQSALADVSSEWLSEGGV
jgi:hypothetical protein